MISKLDESVGKVVESLKQNGMLENSIIMFFSDNGAPTGGLFQNSGSNYPLRGVRRTKLPKFNVYTVFFFSKNDQDGKAQLEISALFTVR